MIHTPKVGIGVIIIKDNRILLGKRKNAHGQGTWSFPGGHLEFNETWADCAVREVAEETGMTIANTRFATATNDIFVKDKKHYVTIFMVADHVSGEPEVKEPNKCEQWGWFTWEKPPSPLFIPIINLRKTNFHPLKFML